MSEDKPLGRAIVPLHLGALHAALGMPARVTIERVDFDPYRSEHYLTVASAALPEQREGEHLMRLIAEITGGTRTRLLYNLGKPVVPEPAAAPALDEDTVERVKPALHRDPWLNGAAPVYHDAARRLARLARLALAALGIAAAGGKPGGNARESA